MPLASRSRSPSIPRPEEPPSRSPSPLPSPRPRRVSLPPWVERNSVKSISASETFTRVNKDSVQEEIENDEDLTPYLRVNAVSEDQTSLCRHQEREQAALRELWGAIDGLLGPDGTRLGEYDTQTVASSMYSSATPPADWKGHIMQGTSGVRVHNASGGAPPGAAWWRAFRQGLLFS
ncbi:hypothetical protein VTI74DRAFT_5397 [Chaetomium olivicolor]